MKVQICLSCVNNNCENYDVNINTFLLEYDEETSLDEFLEGFGYGSETTEDKCSKCNLLGQFQSIDMIPDSEKR